MLEEKESSPDEITNSILAYSLDSLMPGGNKKNSTFYKSIEPII